MSKKRILILIPARYQSSRFQGKPLAKIDSKSMIQRVFENCHLGDSDEFYAETFIVTDHDLIEEHAKSFTTNILRVDDDVPSGTLRIALAFERFLKQKSFDLIINVQGDEPLINAHELKRLALFHLNSNFQITTLVRKIEGFNADFFDSNKVKVAMSEKTGQTFYFSRAAIPFKRDKDSEEKNDYWFLHIGVYSYKPSALKEFSEAPMSRLEDLEKLEQLRAMELGLTIGAIETTRVLIGVDHPEDIKKVEEVLRHGK